MEPNIDENPMVVAAANAIPARTSNVQCRDVSIPISDEQVEAEPRTPTSPSSSGTTREPPWFDAFNRFDIYLSGSLMHLPYRIFDTIILLFGIFSSGRNCSATNHLGLTSIAILSFYFIDFWIIISNCFRKCSSRQALMTQVERDEQFRRTAAVRGFFICLKLIPVFFGTIYSFSSTAPKESDCEVLRFCLGIVCFSTWVIVIMPPMKPSLPSPRSLLTEVVMLTFLLAVNGTYIGTVLSSLLSTNASQCILTDDNQIFLGAPLKSYAKLGVLIYSLALGFQIIHACFHQITRRFRNGRNVFTKYYFFQYMLSYIFGIIILYYLSFGAMYLFRPRSGDPCRTEAPSLYRTLLVWQWLRILTPLIAAPLLVLLCCLGVVFGIIFSYCLPASVTVPILELLRAWLSDTPVPIHPNPPATPETVDAIPVILFGQEPDTFNQTECAICRIDFEKDEGLKKLDCGHLFHEPCVKNWLLITRICPICRQRITNNS